MNKGTPVKERNPRSAVFFKRAHFKDRHSNLIRPQVLNDTYIDKPI